MPEREFQLNRRDFIRSASAVLGLAVAGRLSPEASAQTLPPSAINTEKDQDKIFQLTRELVVEANKFGVDAIGYRISNAWKGADDFDYIAYQGAILQKRPDGGVQIWNLLDQMSAYDLDTQLDNGSLGVTVPPHENYDDSGGNLERVFTERAVHFKVPQTLTDFVQGFRKQFEVGVFTSRVKDYGPYRVVRTQRMAFQEWLDVQNKGLIQRVLVGDAARAAGLVPKEVQLAQPDLGSGGGEKIVLPVSRDFEPRYVGPSKMIDIVNPDTGSTGFSPKDAGSLKIIEDKMQEFKVKSIQFIPDASLEYIVGISSWEMCADDSKDPRCRQSYMLSKTTIEKGVVTFHYRVLDPNVALDRDTISWYINGFNGNLGTWIAEAAGDNINSDRARALRGFLRENLPLQFAAPHT